jgi:hypothetical protein
MSQPVGFQYKSRIPSFSDEASIVEALKVYHYGVDDYTTEPIPSDSIEGNFRSINDRVDTVESTISALTGTYLEQVSLTASPNIVTAQSTTTIPFSIRAISSQTSPLQQWQNSSSVSVGSIGTGGNMNLAGYLTLGSTTQSTTIGLNVVIGNASHNGVVVRAQSSQTSNIQEWQNNSGTAVSYVSPTGRLFSNQSETVNLADTQTILNKTLTSPTINGGTLNNASTITLTGNQALTSRARNITISTANPSGGNDGDVWVRYV